MLSDVFVFEQWAQSDLLLFRRLSLENELHSKTIHLVSQLYRPIGLLHKW